MCVSVSYFDKNRVLSSTWSHFLCLTEDVSCCLLKVFAIWFAACVSVCLGCFLDIFFFMTLCLSLVSCLIVLCSLWYFLLVLAVGCWTCISHAVCFYSVRSGCWVSWLISWSCCRHQQEQYLEGFRRVSWFLVCHRFELTYFVFHCLDFKIFCFFFKVELF